MSRLSLFNSPLLLGFDAMEKTLERLAKNNDGYPPYNIERTGENDYRIEIAVAGFKPEELNVEVKENLLTVTGRKAANDDAKQYLHRGLAERNFERKFQLTDYLVVVDADLSNGLLSIELKRELPEALKPRTVEIKTTAASTLIEGADLLEHLTRDRQVLQQGAAVGPVTAGHRRIGVRIAKHGKGFRVGGHRPETLAIGGVLGRLVPVHRRLAAVDLEQVVWETVGEVVQIGEIDVPERHGLQRIAPGVYLAASG